jgi:hypothetical protein
VARLEITRDQFADAVLDCLALIEAAERDDDAGIDALSAGCNIAAVAGTALMLLTGVLRDHGIDPAGWAAEERARIA